MKKEDLIKIAVVAVVLFFIFESVAIGVIGRPSEPQNPVQNTNSASGIVQVNATLQSYEPYLLANNLDEQKIQQISSITGVEEVISTGSGYAISLKSSSDAPKIYSELIKLGVQSTATANLQLPDSVQITQFGSIVNTLTGGALLKMATEPFIEPGSQVPLTFTGTSQNGFLVSYSNPTLVPSPVSIEASADIDSFEYLYQLYEVPWEERNGFDGQSLKSFYGSSASVSYSRSDYVEFATLLDSQKLLAKPDYVNILNEKSASVSADFANKEQIIQDFGPDVLFPYSKIELKLESETPNPVLENYSSTTKFIHNLTLSSSQQYSFVYPELTMALEKRYEEGKSVKLNISGLATGSKIIKILDIRFIGEE